MNINKYILANICHPPEYGKVEFTNHALIGLDRSGIIQFLLKPTDATYQEKLKQAKKEERLIAFDDSKLILPGFIDLHIHAPQWPQAGVALDSPLYDWLDNCTFPLESKYSNPEFSKEVYNNLVDTLLAHGTTTALYFASANKNTSLSLAKICAKKGQRAFVGKVVMDNPDQTPDYYRDESSQAALLETEDFCKEVEKLAQNTLQGIYPVITPRFIPSCTDSTLKNLGELAPTHNYYVQSHCSESDWEDSYVFNRFGKSDAEMLKSFGLLGPRSIMAHCVKLDTTGANIFAETGTSIAHCPISNAYFANSVLPVAKFQRLGINIGLGSDISGGFSPSIYDNLRQAVIVSRLLEDGVDSSLPSEKRGKANSRITLAKAFWHATVGGGQALKLKLGLFKKDYSFDAQVIDLSTLPTYGGFDNQDSLWQKALYLTNSPSIKAVFVQGKKVYQNQL